MTSKYWWSTLISTHSTSFMRLQAEGSRDGITNSTGIIQKGIGTPHLLQWWSGFGSFLSELVPE